jgi:hypothetical protein
MQRGCCGADGCCLRWDFDCFRFAAACGGEPLTHIFCGAVEHHNLAQQFQIPVRVVSMQPSSIDCLSVT